MRIRSTEKHHGPVTAAILAGLLSALAIAGVVSGRALESSALRPGHQEALAKSAADLRRFSMRLHYAGNTYLAISNYAQYGIGGSNVDRSFLDRLGINYSPSFEFPKGTRNDYNYVAGFWFGGIVGNDTLVSRTVKGDSEQGSDEINSYDTMMEASTVLGSTYYISPDSVDTVEANDCKYVRQAVYADQQFKAVYSDTAVYGASDEFEGRRHKPLGIEVTQYSYTWNSTFAQNFVIIELFIKNVSDSLDPNGVGHPISDFILGVFCDYDVFNKDIPNDGASSDISGFLREAPNLYCSEYRDTLNIAWAADDDGDPRGGDFPNDAARGVAGVRFLNAPPNKGISFNWWTFENWAPAKIGSGDPVGIPSGDRRTFYMMANQTVDYGQVYAGIDYSDDGWRKPTPVACGVAAGADTRQVISCGPLENPILPGKTVRFAIALVAGDNFHTDGNPGEFDCKTPDDFFRKKDFSELAKSAQWASWIYDAPGVNDGISCGYDCGYKGEYHLCGAETTIVFDPDSGTNVIRVVYRDTIPYTGDLGPAPGFAGTGGTPCFGLPNLSGPAPPPAPRPGATTPSGVKVMAFETEPGIVRLTWNGYGSETTPDPLSKKLDFEGYRVYVARSNISDQYSLLASWDREDYKRYVFDSRDGSWSPSGDVRSVERLRQESQNPSLDPSLYYFSDTALAYWGITGPAGDTLPDGSPILRYSYFVPWDQNRANTYRENGRVETNRIWRDSLHTEVTMRVDTISADSITYTADTLIYGFYHFDLANQNPSMGQYFAVTAFDQGDPAIDLNVLESPAVESNVFAVPIYSAGVVMREKLGVAVYPNPYKISYEVDGAKTNYYAQGWEGRGAGRAFDAAIDRRINFINLPDTARIEIYTLAGDLVRTIDHPDENLSTYSSKCSWDLVTRNAQAVVSGIYIYRVTSKLESQIGKIVIIK